jgi:hypothetical protein
MIYLISAISFGWIASFWEKKGIWNLVIAFWFVMLAIINAALAGPLILHLVGQS